MNHRVHGIMEKQRKVLLYGDTLLLAALHASLASYSALDVTAVPATAASEEELLTLKPDVIIFDAGAVQPTIVHEATEKVSNLLMVGIDSSCNRASIWSRQHLYELSTCNLVELIERFLSQDTRP